MVASGLQRRRIELLLDKVDYLPTLPGVAGGVRRVGVHCQQAAPLQFQAYYKPRLVALVA